jgi:PAS domain-containing protein
VSCAYTMFVYAVIAYIIEIRNKQAFLGKEQAEKAFHIWLKIFETFPEGVAVVRNNFIVYANKAFLQILGIKNINLQAA